MPIIKFVSGKVTKEIKQKLIKKLTNISAEITGIPKESFFVLIHEIPDDDIAVGGKTVKEIKKH
ncbi:4-oxalocrotonate tautomerase DmpI [Flavivirga abyssicola]|uniref:4-oxalocrotonate tautomerase DmpI n=1 Tax=Flavivirga abyssicola TaxID=3063533 RepID=UPI0026DF9D02|nr:4-oxalocrotonate tautomerase DmpI [Flavivirga sp. MEBiC07777]WVK14373.1 4-oxalocrotonate tautomerase DmpI [Flavivirga sp. MEBiC07777]